MKFYKCDVCKSVAMEIVTGVCEGTPVFGELTANTEEAAHEKHLPVLERDGEKVVVKVGSIEHPMLEAHYITCIYVETCEGGYFKQLKPEMKPEAEFIIPQSEKIVAVYEYCNLHGLWKTEISE